MLPEPLKQTPITSPTPTFNNHYAESGVSHFLLFLSVLHLYDSLNNRVQVCMFLNTTEVDSYCMFSSTFVRFMHVDYVALVHSFLLLYNILLYELPPFTYFSSQPASVVFFVFCQKVYILGFVSPRACCQYNIKTTTGNV